MLPVKKFLIDFYAKLSGDDTTKKSKKKFVAMVFLEFSANKQVKAIEKVFLYNTVSLKKNLFASGARGRKHMMSAHACC